MSRLRNFNIFITLPINSVSKDFGVSLKQHYIGANPYVTIYKKYVIHASYPINPLLMTIYSLNSYTELNQME